MENPMVIRPVKLNMKCPICQAVPPLPALSLPSGVYVVVCECCNRPAVIYKDGKFGELIDKKVPRHWQSDPHSIKDCARCGWEMKIDTRRLTAKCSNPLCGRVKTIAFMFEGEVSRRENERKSAIRMIVDGNQQEGLKKWQELQEKYS